MSGIPEVIWLALTVVNALAFLIMLWDKVQSRRNGAERVSEGMLFFLAAAFGSVGVYAGMFAFRHKTRKWYFLIGIPLIALQNLASAYVLGEAVTEYSTFGGGV
jgi:uncharacterized membrane protein YsdA (DUF1294 family)